MRRLRALGAARRRSERLRRWNAGQTVIATKPIIAANVLVFLIGLSGGNLVNGERSVQFDLGLSAVPLRNGEWYRLITSGFTHAGLLHLGLNMWFVWVLGQMLERALGPVRFTLLYFAALLAGSAGALIADPFALTVGASGAAFGLLGAMVVGMRQRGMSVLRSNIGMLLILNLVLTFAIPGIAIGGHIGGLDRRRHLRRGPARAQAASGGGGSSWCRCSVMAASVAHRVLGGLELAANGLRAARAGRSRRGLAAGDPSSTAPSGATTRLRQARRAPGRSSRRQPAQSRQA